MTSSQTRASGSSRVRQVRGGFLAEGGVGSASIRRALATDIPALAAASFWVWVVRKVMNSLACRSVMCLPGKTAPIAGRAEHDRQAGGAIRGASAWERSCGRATPSLRSAPMRSS